MDCIPNSLYLFWGNIRRQNIQREILAGIGLICCGKFSTDDSTEERKDKFVFVNLLLFTG
jgi:hypothetical protein